MNDVPMPKPIFPLRFDPPAEKKATTYSIQDSGRGVVFGAHTVNGGTPTTLIPALGDDTALAKSMGYIAGCARAFVADITDLDKNFKGSELAMRTRGAAVARFQKPLAELQTIGIKEAGDTAVSRATLTSVDVATVANAHLRNRAIAQWDAADRTTREKIAVSDATPYETTAALIEANLLDDVSDRAREAAIERYAAQRWLAKSGSQAHQIQPNFENPLACGADRKAAMTAARAEIANLKSREDAISITADTIRNICAVLSDATGMSPSETYRLLIASKAA